MQFRHERTDAPSKSCVIPFSLMLSNRRRNIPNCHSVYFNEKNHYYIEILMEVLTTYQLKIPAKYKERILYPSQIGKELSQRLDLIQPLTTQQIISPLMDKLDLTETLLIDGVEKSNNQNCVA